MRWFSFVAFFAFFTFTFTLFAPSTSLSDVAVLDFGEPSAGQFKRTYGGFREVDVNRADVKEVALHAVETHMPNGEKMLLCDSIVVEKAEVKVVNGLVYRLTIRAPQCSGESRLFNAEVFKSFEPDTDPDVWGFNEIAAEN